MGSATNLIKEVPAEKRELIMIPDRTKARRLFPRARRLIRKTKATVRSEKKKALKVIKVLLL